MPKPQYRVNNWGQYVLLFDRGPVLRYLDGDEIARMFRDAVAAGRIGTDAEVESVADAVHLLTESGYAEFERVK